MDEGVPSWIREVKEACGEWILSWTSTKMAAKHAKKIIQAMLYSTKKITYNYKRRQTPVIKMVTMAEKTTRSLRSGIAQF